MFTVKHKDKEFTATEEVAMAEWWKGAKVYSADGKEAVGIEYGVTGEFFMFD